MKIYKYYIKRCNCPEVFSWKDRGNPNDYILYAFTKNKEYAKRFEKERNMKLFHKKVQDDAEKCDLNEIKHTHRMSELVIYDLIYFNHGVNIHKKNRDAEYKSMLCTNSEREIIDTRMENPIIANFDFVNPAIFKDDIIKVLEELQYVSAYRMWLMMSDSIYLSSMSDLLDRKVHNSYDTPMVNYDEVQLFVDYFSCLF